MKKEYWFDPKISWKAFKEILAKFPDSGPTPKKGDRILFEMLRDRKINIGLENSDDPIFITLKQIPKNGKVIKDGNKNPPCDKCGKEMKIGGDSHTSYFYCESGFKGKGSGKVIGVNSGLQYPKKRFTMKRVQKKSSLKASDLFD